MKHRYALFASALALCHGVKAQYWEQRANLPDTAYAPYGFSIGDRVFTGSGVRTLAPFTENTGFNEYLPVSDTWVPRAACPGPARFGVGGFSVNGKGYVACGWSGSPATALNDVWEYDPTADAWTQKSDFPGSARYSCVSVATSTKAYIGLGHATWLNDWWEYDPAADTWTQRASLPAPGRAACGAFVIDDEVYVTVGSRDVTPSTATFLMDLYRYSPASDTWTALAPFPAAGRSGPYSFSFGGVGYVMCGSGGDANAHQVFNDAWAYRPETNQWYQLGLFPGTPMCAGFACSTSSTCYIGAGSTAIASTSWVASDLTDAFWEYQPTGLIGLEEQAVATGIQVLTDVDGVLVRWSHALRPVGLELVDARGRSVRSARLNEGVSLSRFQTTDLMSGMYIVRVTGTDFSAQEKFMVMH